MRADLPAANIGEGTYKGDGADNEQRFGDGDLLHVPEAISRDRHGQDRAARAQQPQADPDEKASQKSKHQEPAGGISRKAARRPSARR